MVYRPDIDGLRGIAILLVVIFHSGLPYFSGGFVGVDIFFVISGYLITSIILSDVESGKFSYVRFYERRVRRILPALYVMMAVVLLITALVQVPVDFIQTAKITFFATFFSSNIFFWRTVGYFGGDSEFEFLLHTWSLGVEEQFYFLFPVVILWFSHRRQWLLIITLLAFVVSLFLSIFSTYYFEWASYYLLPSRGWQMMSGALLAINVCKRQLSERIAGILSAIGLLMILAAAIFYSKDTRFPGVAALLPTLGATLLIYTGGLCSTSWCYRLLGCRWLLFIGLLSYSLYLWHWPVFALIRNYQADVRLGISMSLLGLVVSFILAYLSWRFIETPFRDRTSISRRKVCMTMGVASALLVSICLLVIFLEGVPSRVPSEVVRLSGFSESSVIDNVCMQKTKQDLRNNNICFLGDQDVSTATVAIWGDSHAGALKEELSLALTAKNRKGLFFAATGCQPLLGALRTNSNGGKKCLEFNDEVFQSISGHRSIDVVVLHARWALSVEGTRYGAEGGVGYQLIDTLSHEASSVGVVEQTLMRTTSKLIDLGKRVVIIAGVPEIGYPVPKVMANNLFWGKSVDVRPPFPVFSQRQNQVKQILERVSKKYSAVSIVHPESVLCDQHVCHIQKDGNPLYFDDDHLSDLGARLVVEKLSPLL